MIAEHHLVSVPAHIQTPLGEQTPGPPAAGTAWGGPRAAEGGQGGQAGSSEEAGPHRRAAGSHLAAVPTADVPVDAGTPAPVATELESRGTAVSGLCGRMHRAEPGRKCRIRSDSGSTPLGSEKKEAQRGTGGGKEAASVSDSGHKVAPTPPNMLRVFGPIAPALHWPPPSPIRPAARAGGQGGPPVEDQGGVGVCPERTSRAPRSAALGFITPECPPWKIPPNCVGVSRSQVDEVWGQNPVSAIQPGPPPARPLWGEAAPMHRPGPGARKERALTQVAAQPVRGQADTASSQSGPVRRVGPPGPSGPRPGRRSSGPPGTAPSLTPGTAGWLAFAACSDAAPASPAPPLPVWEQGPLPQVWDGPVRSGLWGLPVLSAGRTGQLRPYGLRRELAEPPATREGVPLMEEVERVLFGAEPLAQIFTSQRAQSRSRPRSAPFSPVAGLPRARDRGEGAPHPFHGPGPVHPRLWPGRADGPPGDPAPVEVWVLPARSPGGPVGSPGPAPPPASCPGREARRGQDGAAPRRAGRASVQAPQEGLGCCSGP
ncbi:collagen alpha-1(I) chain-like [Neofelis nebulosa]|uniref:collagen alpha-1(I) chain-like n=1 Tax=Neofelis nebulosa TaxID=61452 RepID=UPI00272CDED3|nr:collagen alpha-1(I) chain-like [Neofelis nebulosa]